MTVVASPTNKLFDVRTLELIELPSNIVWRRELKK